MTLPALEAASTARMPPSARDGMFAGLYAWYRVNGRHSLPWRLTRDPYAVLVSEVMLQQTRVSRVIPAWTAWLQRWPTARSLAAAQLDEVIRAWAGMGYNRRAVHLHRAATSVSADHGGRIPLDPAALRRLPGVGPYTAAAVASFAGQQQVPTVDTNVGRVLARYAWGLARASEVPPARLQRTAEDLLPAEGPACREHNLALMDLGAAVCTARAPGCDACPLADVCAWRLSGSPPPSVPRRASPPRFEATARFARGRIVDALRVRPRSTAVLAALLPPPHSRRVEEYLGTLLRDGLVAPGRGGTWQLAGAQGNSNIASPNE
jgi:A/G-specific adenine glycosylase